MCCFKQLSRVHENNKYFFLNFVKLINCLYGCVSRSRVHEVFKVEFGFQIFLAELEFVNGRKS